MSSKKTQKESWFKGLDREFKKIVWPDKMTVAKETAAGCFCIRGPGSDYRTCRFFRPVRSRFIN